jgi:hypothetical protein
MLRSSEFFWRTGILTIGLSLFAGASFADTRERELEELARRMPGVAPEPGREKAPVQEPLWCNGKIGQGNYPLSLARTFESWPSNGFNTLIDAAQMSCDFGKDAAGQTAAAMIAQTWINLTGLSYKDAVESIAARVNKSTWDNDHEKLCESLSISDEVIGEERAFMKTRRVLFGCPGYAQWGERTHPPDELVAYLDQSAIEPDELVRLGLVLDSIPKGNGAQSMDRAMVSYPIRSYDFRALSPEQALKAVEAPPYAGNRYARVIVKESLGRARIGISELDEEAKKRSKDPDWKELLFTAPQQAIASYHAAAEKYKTEISHSNEFEHKLSGPSKRALVGCEPQLRKDFLRVYKNLPHMTIQQARESLSDPIAGLLFSRLLACMAADGEANSASEMRAKLGLKVRYSRGPRTAAYYAALETVGKIRADRERFPVSPTDYRGFMQQIEVLEDFKYGRRATQNYLLDGHGIVKTVTKNAKGIHVVFAKETHQELSIVCIPTNRILQIRSDGSIQYYEKCHNAGIVTINDTEEDINISPALSEGIVPGRAIQFVVTGGDKDTRLAFPFSIHDKSKKQLIGYYGFLFQ